MRFEGLIAGASFSEGDTVVAGLWRSSPLGSFRDVMWVRPDGTRVLLAPSPQVREFLVSVYAFDRSHVVPVRGGWQDQAITLEAGPLRISLTASARDWRSWLFALRPRWLLRRPTWICLEDRLARPLVGRLIGGASGVRAAGVAPGGQREWYGIEDYRGVADGSLSVEGRDAGGLVDLPADLGIGLSAFPTRPAIVYVTTTLEDDESDGDRGPPAVPASDPGTRTERGL